MPTTNPAVFWRPSSTGPSAAAGPGGPRPGEPGPGEPVGDGQGRTADDTGAPGGRRWCLGTTLVVAATAAWAAFLLLHVALTGRWWVWFLVEAVPPVAFAVVPALLLAVVWWARPVRRRLTPVLVVLLLAGGYLAGVGPGWRGDTRPAGPGDAEVSIVSWNTDYWEMDDDPEAFYAFLREKDADVYLLQEYLHWEGEGPVLIDSLARLRAEFPGYEAVVEGELLTLSRLPVAAVHSREAPATDNAWYWQGGKAQRTDLLVGPGRVLSVYNVHFPVPFRVGDNPLTSRFWNFLAKQHDWWTREADALRSDLAANPNTAVVAGDFNSPWLGSLLRLGDGTAAHSPGPGPLPAFSWPLADYPVPRAWRLDWLFTTGEAAVPEYRFTDSAGFSDHAAQEFTLVVRDADRPAPDGG
ncbi:endonuclease/exonuclease/phosphatase family protein [Saccharothrix xinjiangensis]|uniref:Endonuclease/exonuclease/phosphatase family protein n=1 Tax=Saccharothrix xinjiangensis TaxID=204798 RepID=A0ABV9YA44_9PSEU